MFLTLKIKGTDGMFEQNVVEFVENEDFKVCIEFSNKNVYGQFVLVGNLNGRERRCSIGVDRVAVFPADWLSKCGAGEMTFDLLQFTETGAVQINKGAYKIEPLVLQRTDTGGWTGSAVIGDLRRRVTALEQRIDALTEWQTKASTVFARVVTLLEENENQGG